MSREWPDRPIAARQFQPRRRPDDFPKAPGFKRAESAVDAARAGQCLVRNERTPVEPCSLALRQTFWRST